MFPPEGVNLRHLKCCRCVHADSRENEKATDIQKESQPSFSLPIKSSVSFHKSLKIHVTLFPYKVQEELKLKQRAWLTNKNCCFLEKKKSICKKFLPSVPVRTKKNLEKKKSCLICLNRQEGPGGSWSLKRPRKRNKTTKRDTKKAVGEIKKKGNSCLRVLAFLTLYSSHLHFYLTPCSARELKSKATTAAIKPGKGRELPHWFCPQCSLQTFDCFISLLLVFFFQGDQ